MTHHLNKNFHSKKSDQAPLSYACSFAPCTASITERSAASIARHIHTLIAGRRPDDYPRPTQPGKMADSSNKMTNLNYISARDTTSVQRWRGYNEWRLQPATFLLTPGWLTRLAYQLRHGAMPSKERKILFIPRSLADDMTPISVI